MQVIFAYCFILFSILFLFYRQPRRKRLVSLALEICGDDVGLGGPQAWGGRRGPTESILACRKCLHVFLVLNFVPFPFLTDAVPGTCA